MLGNFRKLRHGVLGAMLLLPAAQLKACDLGYSNGIFTVSGGTKAGHRVCMTDDPAYALQWIAENC